MKERAQGRAESRAPGGHSFRAPLSIQRIFNYFNAHQTHEDASIPFVHLSTLNALLQRPSLSTHTSQVTTMRRHPYASILTLTLLSQLVWRSLDYKASTNHHRWKHNHIVVT